MAKTRLSTAATYVQRGYGQVEPNHLSAQTNGQIYAQLPAASDITVLENGQFAKYDYQNNVVNYTGDGEWMLVFNEVKTYRDIESDCDFAMLAQDYGANYYSPAGTAASVASMDYSNIAATPNPNDPQSMDGALGAVEIASPVAMPSGTSMVPRLFKTAVGDIFTTNTVAETTLALGDKLTPNASGYLTKTGASSAAMQWKVVKVYTMPDGQNGVKVMRIA